MPRLPPAVLVISAAALVAGCSHGAKKVKAGPCAQARAAAAKRVVHGALRGDVDGDGRPDSVSLVRLRANSRCGAFLVVRTGSETFTHALRTTSSVPPVPTLNGLAALGFSRGLAIVVTTWEGASTEFARVFAVRKGHIFAPATKTFDGTFPYVGSVTHFDAVDCASPGSIVASGWFERGASGRQFGFERRFYRVGERSFELLRVQKGRTRSALPQSGRFREFREPQPFPSCMQVRAAS